MTRFSIVPLLLLALGACSDPLDRVDRLSNVPLDEAAGDRDVAASDEDAAPEGILAAMFGRARPEPSSAESEDARESTEAVIDAAAPEEEEDPSTADIDEEEDTPSAPTAAAAPERGGFLGIFRSAPRGEAAGAGSDEGAGVQVASARVGSTPNDGAAAGGGLRGLFGGASASRPDPNAPDIAADAKLSFGQVGRLCGTRAGAVGKEIARWPESGGKYRLYDSFPGATGMRPFYVSGFDDGCLRRFDAALAMFGDPAMHEQLRYGLPAKQLPYSTTDKGYETVKSRVCRVSAQKPCGAQIARLQRDTVFVTSYDRFGGGQRWGNILLHGGEIVATDVKAK